MGYEERERERERERASGMKKRKMVMRTGSQHATRKEEERSTTEGRSFERKTVESLTWTSAPIAAPT